MVPCAHMRKTALSCLLALALVIGMLPAALVCSAPGRAYAATDNIEAELTESQRKIEESAAAYDAAVARIAELDRQIEDNRLRIAEINRALPDQMEKGSRALVDMYKMQQEGAALISIVLESDSLMDFLERLEYVKRVYSYGVDELNRLKALRQELDRAQRDLEEARAQSTAEMDKAAASLAQAQEQRERVQREAQEKAAAEAKRAEEESEGHRFWEEQGAGGSDIGGGPGGAMGFPESGTITPPENDDADWSCDKATFVSAWSPRIDAYLSGSPLSGQGEAFAVAAWDYGVDPRWSPAISCVESSKGAACFLPHNAWGWGSVSWGSWDEAIDSHVRGLARGYGYTLTEEAAKKYCPPNWEHWYNRVGEEMNKI